MPFKIFEGTRYEIEIMFLFINVYDTALSYFTTIL